MLFRRGFRKVGGLGLRSMDLDVVPDALDCLAGGGEMGAAMRAVDWATTPFGPVASWPQSLRTAITVMLESHTAMAIAWGPDRRLFYNDRYRAMFGRLVPLGSPADVFPWTWDVVGPELVRAERGQAFALEDSYVPLDRRGYRESCWFNVSYSAIREGVGEVSGLLAVVHETTPRVEGERRLATLHELAVQTAKATTPELVCGSAVATFERNPLDVPFALIFALADDHRTTRLVARAGVAEGHPALAAERWPLGNLTSIAVVDDLAAQFGALPGGPGFEPARAAIVLPLTRRGLAYPYGVLVAGISSRRALDDRYRRFFELAADHVAAEIGNAHVLEAKARLERALATAEHERERARDELASTREYNDRFASMIGHDLRNPLHAIQTSAELLQRRATTTDIVKPATRVVLSCERMARMIAQLLDLASVHGLGLQLRPRLVDLGELSELVLGELRQAHPEAKVELLTTGVLHGRWDGDRLAQVLANLAGNAVEHGVPRTPVRVHLDGRDPGIVTLRVENRGEIPEDVLPVLFDPFRGPEHRNEKARGLGLGLYISRQIVAAHHGTMAVRTSAEEGTCFEIELPKLAEMNP